MCIYMCVLYICVLGCAHECNSDHEDMRPRRRALAGKPTDRLHVPESKTRAECNTTAFCFCCCCCFCFCLLCCSRRSRSRRRNECSVA